MPVVLDVPEAPPGPVTQFGQILPTNVWYGDANLTDPVDSLTLTKKRIGVRLDRLRKLLHHAECGTNNQRTNMNQLRNQNRVLLFWGLFSAVAVVVSNVGCNQQRYQPAEWRAAPRAKSSNATSQIASNGSATSPEKFGQLTPWLSAEIPTGFDSGGGSWSTLPGRNGYTLPMRNGMTLPMRGGTTLPLSGWNRFGGTTLPMRMGNGTTLPGGRDGASYPGITFPNQSGITLPLRNETTLPYSR